MKLKQMTQNMTIATYLNDNPDKQVVAMANRYSKQTRSPSIRRTLRLVIKAPMPSLLVSRVYDEVCNVPA